MQRHAAKVKNRVRASTMYPVLAGYALAVTGLYSVMDGGGAVATLALGAILYLGASMLAAWMIYQHELGKVWAAPNEFRRHLPFHSYGTVVRSFQHVFYTSDDVLLDVQRGIKAELVRRGLARNFRIAQLTDADGELTAEEARNFCLATGTTSPKNTVVTIAIHPRAEGGTQCISWWLMIAGFVDQDRVFRFVSLAPLSLPFWVLGYLRGEVDVIAKVRNTYSGFYRDLDLTMTARAVHDAMHTGLVTTLALLGVDTSDLSAVSAVRSGSGFSVPSSTSGGSVAPASQAPRLSAPAPAAQSDAAFQVGTTTMRSSVAAPPSLPPPSGRAPYERAQVPTSHLADTLQDDEEVTRPMPQPIPEPFAPTSHQPLSAVYKKKTRAA